MGCGLWSFLTRMRCMFLIHNYFPEYYMQILINLELCNIGIPKVIASYVLEKEDWEPILRFIEDSDIDMYILEEDFCADKIHINKNTLFFKEITDVKKIEAFLTLHGREYYTFDLLAFIKNNMKNTPRSPAGDDQNMPFEMEESYYLQTKKNTPEFSLLDDEKIKQMIRETKKTMKLFKDS